MIHVLAKLDHGASTGTTPWHRASALGKLLLAAGIVGVAVATHSLLLVATLHLIAWVLLLTSGLPKRVAIAAAAYPLVFLVLVVAARWDGTPATVLLLVLRPLTASLTAVWLVGTTPYPDLFAPLSRVLPRGVGDGLFLTYRAVFALYARVESMWSALRLRGAMARPLQQRFSLLGEAVGTVVLSGFDRSHRLYQAMQLRGHSGRVCGCRHYLEFTRDDFWVALAVAWAAVVSLSLWHLRIT